MFFQQQLQGRTVYGPRVRADKARARRREDIGTPEAAPSHQPS
jgi:hypothetical protein